LQFDKAMDGRRLKFLNSVEEFSRLCLAIRVSRRCKDLDVIDTTEELLNQYPAPPICAWTMDLNSLSIYCRNGAQAADAARRTSRQTHPEKIQLSNNSTASLEIISCKRSRPEAIHRAAGLVAGSQAVGRAVPDEGQHLQTAFDAPKSYALGDPPAVERGLSTRKHSKKLDQ
jgi:hypothetical protein